MCILICMWMSLICYCIYSCFKFSSLFCKINLKIADNEESLITSEPGPKVIKLFSCSTQLSMKFILLINVKMATIVAILTLINRINSRLWSFKPENSIDFGNFNSYEKFKFQAQLS